MIDDFEELRKVKEKKPFVDPFGRWKVFLEVADEAGKLLIEGKIELNSRVFNLADCEQISPTFLIHKGYAAKVNCDFDHVAFAQPRILEGKERVDFIEEFSKEPYVKWKTAPVLAQDPYPILKLQDRSGAFADLWMDYGALGQYSTHDHSIDSWRNPTAEKGWEKDLLETDFQAKIVGSSHYYCPLDKVAKSLTFLLEIGWKIFDHKGRRLVRETGSSLELTEKPHAHVLRGKVHYEEHEADVTSLVGAFNRRESFVDLSPNTVALLDREKWADLAHYDVEDGEVAIKKSHFGLLGDFIEKHRVRTEVKFGLNKTFSPPSASFIGTLHPYQQEGVDWLAFLHASGLPALLADEMGLGKTVQVLAFLSRLSLLKPVLVVAPTSLLFNWRRECAKFLPSFAVHEHSGPERTKDLTVLQQPHILLTSYALLRLDAPLFQQLDCACIILDEGHMIKNAESQIAKVAFALTGEMRLIITGTPVENRLDELWSLFHFLIPELLPEKTDIIPHIKKKTGPFILRRRKKEIEHQLPEKNEQIIWVEMGDEQRSLYEEWLAQSKRGLGQKNQMEIFEALLRLRQICCHPWLVDGAATGESAKLEQMMADLEEAIQEGHKILVYSQFTSMLSLIRKRVEEKGWRYSYLDGSTQNREKAVQEFETDETIPLFLISLKAGGVGLNLTAADYVFIYDPWWNDAVEQQAIDRVHRLGQKRAVIARRYVTALSIEEKIMRLKEHKLSLAKGLLDHEEGDSSLTIEDLKELLS